MKEVYLAVRILMAAFCCPACTNFLKADEDADKQPRRAFIEPSLVRLRPGRQQRFKVILVPGALEPAALPKKVKWSVDAVPGGNDALGTIDANGPYRAPNKTPSPPEIHICAVVEQAKNRYLFATVLMGQPVYRLVKNWTEPEGTSRCIRDPHGIAIACDGTLIIADRDISKVSRYTIEGRLLHYIGKGESKEAGHPIRRLRGCSGLRSTVVASAGPPQSCSAATP